MECSWHADLWQGGGGCQCSSVGVGGGLLAVPPTAGMMILTALLSACADPFRGCMRYVVRVVRVLNFCALVI